MNNSELRGGGGFITHQIEVSFIFAIPYKIKNIKFLDINNVVISSFEPFKSNLSKKLSFRDSNYSIFNEENYKRLSYFSEKSLGYKHNNIILFNFSFIESIFTLLSIKFSGFNFNKKTLFRNLSHIVSDNPDGAYERKNIIMRFGFKLIILILLIPFYPHFILFNVYKSIKKKDFYILNKNYKDIPSGNYIGIEENNIIGRKGNRYLSNYTEYNFLVEELKGNYIYGNGTIKILKTLLAGESFPISGDYKACIKGVFSNNFKYDKKYKLIKIKNTDSLFYEIKFSFKLPKKGNIDIIKGPGILNNNITVNFQTKIFYLLANTNLKNKIDHLNKDTINFKKNFKLKYNVFFDKSPIKFINMRIVRDGVISIIFNKELINLSKKNFIIKYKGNDIGINKIQKVTGRETNIFVYYKKGEIDYYDFRKKKDLATLSFYNIIDKSGVLHYNQARELNLIWQKKV